MDEDEEDNSEEEQDGVTMDKDALAYIRSRKQVHKLHAAAKLMWLDYILSCFIIYLTYDNLA